jgi:hypothetical protein
MYVCACLCVRAFVYASKCVWVLVRTCIFVYASKCPYVHRAEISCQRAIGPAQSAELGCVRVCMCVCVYVCVRIFVCRSKIPELHSTKMCCTHASDTHKVIC